MRVAVIGTGSIGRRHLANLYRIGVSNLVAVSEFNKRETLDVEGHRVEIARSLSEIIDKVDAVVIANPTAFHLDFLRQAIVAGRHVYLEKPASHSSAGLAELDAEARRKELVVCVGSQFRFNEGLVRVKTMLEAGRLGRLLNVSAYSGENIADYHPAEDYRTGYAARADLGGGVLLTQIHQIDYLNWLFGGFRSAFAIATETVELGIEVETCVSYLLESERSLSVTGHLNYLQRPKHTGLDISGADARISWCYEDNSVSLVARQPELSETWSAPTDRNVMFQGILRDFLEAIQQRRALRSPLSDGIAAVRIVEAIKRSTTSRCREGIAA